MRAREKRAALLIERYYKRYKEVRILPSSLSNFIPLHDRSKEGTNSQTEAFNIVYRYGTIFHYFKTLTKIRVGSNCTDMKSEISGNMVAFKKAGCMESCFRLPDFGKNPSCLHLVLCRR